MADLFTRHIAAIAVIVLLQGNIFSAFAAEKTSAKKSPCSGQVSASLCPSKNIPAGASVVQDQKNEVIPLSLAQAMDFAFKNNKDILIEENEITIAQAQIIEAQSGFLPRAGVTAGYTHKDAVMETPAGGGISRKDSGIFTGYTNENKVALQVNQPLYQGGKNTSELKQARVRLNIQKESVRAKKLSIAFEVKRLYYGVLLATETERIMKTLVDQAQAHYNDVKKAFQQGTVSAFDSLQSKVYVAKTKPQLVNAKNARELISAELKKLLGIRMEEICVLTDSLEYVPLAVHEEIFLKQAYLNQPLMIMKALGVDVNKEGIIAAHAGWRPQADAVFNYEYKSDDVSNMVNARHRNWNIGFQVTVPLFDGFTAKAKVDQAKARYEQAVLEKEDFVQQIALDIRRACFDLTDAAAIIQSQTECIGEAKEALKIAYIRYANGIGTNLDVLDSQVTLSQIEKNLCEGIYDYLIAQAYLEKTMGKQANGEGEKNEKK